MLVLFSCAAPEFPNSFTFFGQPSRRQQCANSSPDMFVCFPVALDMRQLISVQSDALLRTYTHGYGSYKAGYWILTYWTWLFPQTVTSRLDCNKQPLNYRRTDHIHSTTWQRTTTQLTRDISFSKFSVDNKWLFHWPIDSFTLDTLQKQRGYYHDRFLVACTGRSFYRYWNSPGSSASNVGSTPKSRAAMFWNPVDKTEKENPKTFRSDACVSAKRGQTCSHETVPLPAWSDNLTKFDWSQTRMDYAQKGPTWPQSTLTVLT